MDTCGAQTVNNARLATSPWRLSINIRSLSSQQSSILVSFFDNCLINISKSRMKLQVTAHCFRVVSLRPYYYRSRHSTRNVPKKFVTYRTRYTYICTNIHTHTYIQSTRTNTHKMDTYASNTRNYTRHVVLRGQD